MNKILKFMLLCGVLALGTLALPQIGFADEGRDVTVTGLATGSGVAQATQNTRSDNSSCALGSGSAQGTARAGAQVIREPNAITIIGVGSGAAGVDTRNVQGSTSGSGLVMLRIGWGNGSSSSKDRDDPRNTGTNRSDGRGGASDRGRGVASPPGAPEMPGDLMFGSGFLVLGFGLLLTRRRLW